MWQVVSAHVDQVLLALPGVLSVRLRAGGPGSGDRLLFFGFVVLVTRCCCSSIPLMTKRGEGDGQE